MKVFVTGATGFVGTTIVRELLIHGHQVLGLARSESGDKKLLELGAEVLRGDLEELRTLRRGAEETDAVVHTGFIHDFARFAYACEVDRAAIETLGEAIGNAGKPLIVTAGIAFLETLGSTASEATPASPSSEDYPRLSEAAAEALSSRGIPTGVMRLPPSVHGRGDRGFVPMLIETARQKGFSAYINKGDNVWPAVHVHDAARAFRLAIERGAVADTYHAVAEQGVPFRKIAESIATGLGVPCVSISADHARQHFGWFNVFAAMDQPTSSNLTRSLLGWSPENIDLLADIGNAGYFANARNRY